MLLGLVFPPHRQDALACAIRAAEILKARGVLFCTDPACCPLLPCALSVDPDSPVNAIIAIGGDGTLLRAAKMALGMNAPLLGINTGHMGFLTEAAPDELESALEMILSGRYHLDYRSMLRMTVDGSGSWLALNDAIVTRAGSARLIQTALYVDGQEAGRYKSDGLIVCTPTGSTGYSLSAGGPVVSPHVDCIVITPVCAHSLVHRPLVVDGSASISIQLQSDMEMHSRLEADGQICTELHPGQTVHIERMQQKVALIRLQELRFYERVRTKLSEADL